MLLSGTTIVSLASTSAPPPQPARAASRGEQNGESDTAHGAIRSSSARLELGRSHARRPAPDDLAAFRDEDDEPRLASRVAEPDLFVRHGDRMTEVELVGVLRARGGVVLADHPDDPGGAVEAVDRLRRGAVDPAAALAEAGGEDEEERPLGPQLGAADGRAVDELGRRSRAPAARTRAARRTRLPRAPVRAGRRRRPRPRRRRRSRPAGEQREQREENETATHEGQPRRRAGPFRAPLRAYDVLDLWLKPGGRTSAWPSSRGRSPTWPSASRSSSWRRSRGTRERRTFTAAPPAFAAASAFGSVSFQSALLDVAETR